jgi:dTDP-4-amino-4,6-dideoxygalactose transaminase
LTVIIASPLSHYMIPDMPTAAEVLPWLQQIETNRWYTNYGPLVQAFEQGLQARLQAANPAVAFALTALATGYHALELGLRVLALPDGGQVLVPAVTFPACPLAVQHAGLVPVLADIDHTTWQLTPDIARRAAAHNRLAAIMPVAVYGVPVDVAAWDQFTVETGIPVLIDAAAAFEAQPVPQHCLLAHSFHATKPFGIGEGGALIGAPERIAAARQLSNFGTVARIAHSCGMNAKLSEYHAAVGLAQLARWDVAKARRVAVLALYQAALGSQGARLQSGLAAAVPGLLMLNCAPLAAPELMLALAKRGMATHQTYLPPLYRHPAFVALSRVNGAGFLTELCPEAETLTQHLLGLPFHLQLRAADVAACVHSVFECLQLPLV